MTRGSTSTRLRATLVAVAAVIGAVAPMLTAGPATGAPASRAADCATAYLGPQNAGPKTGNYFNLQVVAGQRLTEHLVAANPTKSRCQVDLHRAYGKTAINSGDTYVTVDNACTGAACWLSNLPKTITLAPNSRVDVPFDVITPAHAEPGQYLAGVVGQPDIASNSKSDRSGVRVQVRTRVAIGVAVTVAGALRPALQIPTVTVDKSQAPYASTLSVVERNGGNTWEHPKGDVTIDAGSTPKHFSVVSNTILGGGVATLRAGAGRITGTHHVRVVLWYANHTKQAVWDGSLTFPTLAPVHKNGNQIIVGSRPASKSVPLWAWIAIGAAALLFALVLILLVVLLRRRRGDDDHDTEQGSTPRLPTEPAPAV